MYVSTACPHFSHFAVVADQWILGLTLETTALISSSYSTHKEAMS